MTLNNRIEHTNLKPDAAREDIIRLCTEALHNNLRGVVVSPYYVKLAKDIIGTRAKVIAVVGYPLGHHPSLSKVMEAKECVMQGADEIDMVMNITAFKNGSYDEVRDEIKEIVTITERPVKVIIETALLDKDGREKAVDLVIEAGAAYVKTSTGHFDGAKKDEVTHIRDYAEGRIKLKASGKIKDFNRAFELIDAGADTLGSSNSLDIIKTQRTMCYLCGAIYGATDEECKDWRDQTEKELKNILCLNPMRRDYRGGQKGNERVIVDYDKKDIDMADFLIVKYEKPSVGTSMEVLLADSLKKPVYIVTEKTRFSPWLRYHSTQMFPDFKQLYEYIREEYG